jgi:plasmid stability protein
MGIMDNNKKTWSVRNMPEDIKRKIRAQAVKEGRPVTEVLIDAIKQYLDKKIVK